MAGIGTQLRAIRLQWGLSLREVEERSFSLAQECGEPSYQISGSWLARVERGKHELTIPKLISLATIYNLPPEELLRQCRPGGTAQPHSNQFQGQGPNTTVLLAKGPLEEQARYLLPDGFSSAMPPEETTLLPPEDGPVPSQYRRAIIGRRDRTLDPMLRAGSIIKIDTQKQAIVSRKEWTNEFDRPIYFLLTHGGYVLRLVRPGQRLVLADSGYSSAFACGQPALAVPKRSGSHRTCRRRGHALCGIVRDDATPPGRKSTGLLL